MIRFSQNILKEIRPRAMTRDIDWGIAIPLDGWRENPTKKLYVWFDAVIGYLSASIEWARRTGDPEAWRQWWNDPEALSYYFMGKDNITFHSQIWPAELLAYSGKGTKGGTLHEYGELNLPTEVVSSEFLTMEGKKFSSSKRVVIYVRDLLSRYQPDAFRYFVAAAGPENQDSDFTWAEFVRRTNDELVAGWGNLVNRTATLISKNFGELPEAGELSAEDQTILDTVGAAFGVVGDLLARHRQKQAITEAMRTVAEVNKYVSDSEPWKIKEDPARLGTVLAVMAQCVADLNLILSPFLPFSANEVDKALGGAGDIAPMPHLEEADDLDGGAPYPIITGDYSGFPGVGAQAARARHAGREAVADLHQARPGRSWTRSWLGWKAEPVREGEPSRTAFGAAALRAVHQEADQAAHLRGPARAADPRRREAAGPVLEQPPAAALHRDPPPLRGGLSGRCGRSRDAAGRGPGRRARHLRLSQPVPGHHGLRGRLPGHRAVEARAAGRDGDRGACERRLRRRSTSRSTRSATGSRRRASTRTAAGVLPVAGCGALPHDRGGGRRRCGRSPRSRAARSSSTTSTRSTRRTRPTAWPARS